MPIWLISILVSAIVIFCVGRVSRSFEVDGFGAALLTAAAMSGAGLILSLPLMPIQAAIISALMGSLHPSDLVSYPEIYAWWAIDLGLDFLINAVLLFVVALLVPGVSVRGVLGVVLAAALLSGVGLLWRIGLPT